MNIKDYLDVLVVYSADVAISAAVEDAVSTHPFLLKSNRANYNLSYAYFLSSCKRVGLSAGFTTSADIIGPGICRNYWKYASKTWIKIDHQARSSNIFDKLSPTSSTRTTERELLLSNELVTPFNELELHATFFDKLRTYKELPEYGVPTIRVSSSQTKDIKAAIKKLRILVKRHRFSNDFSNKIVVKDRFGSAGDHVYKVDSHFLTRIRKIMLGNDQIKFIIQPFLKFNKGYSFKGKKRSTDLRLIFHHNTLKQCYIRNAKAHDFRCNEHQGGKLTYVTHDDVPESIHTVSRKIVALINKPDSLYALDFVISNTGKIYFIEGNTGPGIDWDITKPINEIKSKQLIRIIVSELYSRAHVAVSSMYTPLKFEEFAQAVI